VYYVPKFGPPAIAGLNAYIARNLETARRRSKGSAVCDGLGCSVHHARAEHARVGLDREGRNVDGTGAQDGNCKYGRFVGMKEDPGSATTGHYADLIAVEGDPLLDFQVVIDKVRGVMKGGAVVVQN